MHKDQWQAKLTHEIYCITSGMQGGYMPDSVSYAVTRDSAIDSALWDRDNYLEDDTLKAVGNIRKHGYIAIEAKAGTHSDYYLGYVIEISRVSLDFLGLKESDIAGKALWEVIDLLNNAS